MPRRPRTAAEPAGGALLSPSRVGDVNRSRVLQTLVDHGPLSRAELAKFSNVTRATIGNIVQSLLDVEVLVEQEARSGQVGKPARPLWFAPRAALSLVVAIDDDGCQAALADAAGTLWAHATVAIGRRQPTRRDFERGIDKAVDAVVAEAGDDEIVGIGISVPGTCDPAIGEVLESSVHPALAGTWLHDGLAERFGVPVVVDNDSRAQALAEKWFGLGRGLATFASVLAGRSLGVGLVQNGVVFRVDGGRGAEFGHTVVDVRGEPCRCGGAGCWETIAGTDWIRHEARRRGFSKPDRFTLDHLVEAATHDPEAAALLDDFADNVGVGLTNLMHVYRPQRFILHGEVARAGETVRAAIEAATRRRTVDLVSGDVEVVCSELGERASLLGAAALVLSDRFELVV